MENITSMIASETTRSHGVNRSVLAKKVSEDRISPSRDHVEGADNFSQWAAAMRAGDFSHAWQVNEQCGKRWPSAHQLWNGEPLFNRDVCLHGMHGLGDVVQCIRFVPQLIRQGCRVSCTAARPLIPLMKYFDGISDVYDSGCDCLGNKPNSVHVEFMELLHILRLMPADLPHARNYLWLPYEVKASMGTRIGPMERPRIGLVWRGGAWDQERWVPFPALEPLTSVQAFEWWSLQAEETASDVGSAGVRRFDHLVPNGSLVDLAAAISNMNLLITTDTLAAHIAGAMGVPAWVLLKRDADWRWLRGTDQSPWYPSLRLFRQQRQGDWQGVIQQVRKALFRLSTPSACILERQRTPPIARSSLSVKSSDGLELAP